MSSVRSAIRIPIAIRTRPSWMPHDTHKAVRARPQPSHRASRRAVCALRRPVRSLQRVVVEGGTCLGSAALRNGSCSRGTAEPLASSDILIHYELFVVRLCICALVSCDALLHTRGRCALRLATYCVQEVERRVQSTARGAGRDVSAQSGAGWPAASNPHVRARHVAGTLGAEPHDAVGDLARRADPP